MPPAVVRTASPGPTRAFPNGPGPQPAILVGFGLDAVDVVMLLAAFLLDPPAPTHDYLRYGGIAAPVVSGAIASYGFHQRAQRTHGA